MLAELLTLQALSVALQVEKDWDPVKYVRCHPGGKLGELRENESKHSGRAPSLRRKSEVIQMLKGKLIHPDIMAALALCGHGDKVLIADGNYPWTPRPARQRPCTWG